MSRVADETTACDDCKHQPYDHGEHGCQVVRSTGHRCDCARSRRVLERANAIMDDLRAGPSGTRGETP